MSPGSSQGLFVRDTRFLSRFELRVNGAADRGAGRGDRRPVLGHLRLPVPPPAGRADSTLDGLPLAATSARACARTSVIRNFGDEPAFCSVELFVGCRLRRPLRRQRGAGRRPRGTDDDHARRPRRRAGQLSSSVLPAAALAQTAALVRVIQLSPDRPHLGRRTTWPASRSSSRPGVSGPRASKFTRSSTGRRSSPATGAASRSSGPSRPSGWPSGGAGAPGRDRPRRAAGGGRPQRRGSRGPAHLRSRLPRAGRRGGRGTLVHDRVRSGLAHDRLDGAARRPRPGPGACCRPWPGSRGRTSTRDTTRSRAGSCTRCASARRRRCRSAGGASTTARPTPPRCSSCCSASCGGGAWPAKRSTSCCPTPTGPSSGSSTSATPTATATSSTSGPPTGVCANQGWKDSWDAIRYADGTRGRCAYRPVRGPGLHLRRLPGPGPLRLRGRRQRHLPSASGPRRPSSRRRSTGTSGSRRRGWFAIGLDADKQPIDSLTSNIGHCLWTGIVDEDKARRGGREAAVAPDVQRVGGSDALDASMAGLQPDQLPLRLGVAARHRHRGGRPGPVRLRRRRPALDHRAVRRGGQPRAAGSPSCSAGSTGVSSGSRWATRRRARPRPGRRRRRCCACGRCCASTRGCPTARRGYARTCPRGSATSRWRASRWPARG